MTIESGSHSFIKKAIIPYDDWASVRKETFIFKKESLIHVLFKFFTNGI
jgi:hypothetical protein